METSKPYPVGRAPVGSLFVASGIGRILGFAGVASLGLALLLVPVTSISHAFQGAGAAEFDYQFNHFLKNVAILGAMLAIFDIERRRVQAKTGAGILRARAA